jgi:hypothetical protein
MLARREAVSSLCWSWRLWEAPSIPHLNRFIIQKVISTTNAILIRIYLESTFSQEVSELENLRVSSQQ